MKTISVLGVFVADLCFIANAIPEKGQTILGSQHIVGPGGKGSNQAIAAAKLNGEVNFITKIGKDKNGEMALTIYNELGMNTASIIQDEKHSTGVAGIMVNEKTGDNAINIVPGAAGTLISDDIDRNLNFIEKAQIFLTQLETPYDVTRYALKKAKEKGLVTILNPAPACEIEDDDFQLIDFFTPNETEAEFYLNKKIETEKDIKSASEQFLKKGIKNVVMTLGEKGCYFANEKENFFINAFKLKEPVLDTTGAGDAFNGALAVGLSKDLDLEEALKFANKVAAISTTKQGAAASMPSLEDLNNY
mgnify:FL=1|tara:strand:+ start:87 stop:1001 length:915 start_codon:yes stop_codon:yes gene_type:complete